MTWYYIIMIAIAVLGVFGTVAGFIVKGTRKTDKIDKIDEIVATQEEQGKTIEKQGRAIDLLWQKSDRQDGTNKRLEERIDKGFEKIEKAITTSHSIIFKVIKELGVELNATESLKSLDRSTEIRAKSVD